MSSFVAEFTSINGIDYKVEIITEKGNGKYTLTFSGDPFNVAMSSEEKHIYSAIKGSEATISIVVENPIFDLYTENPQGTKVVFTNTTENKVEWMGYLTPCLYNNGFALPKEVIELEAVDALSTLEDVLYKSSDKSIKSFLQIICNILIKYINPKHLYVSDNLQLNSSSGTETILDKLSVSTMNFFDKKSEDAVLDDDVAWSCLDVLNQICQYLGYVMYQEGEDVFMIDYDAIKSKNPYYYKYDLTKYNQNGEDYILTATPTRISLKHTHKIVGTDHLSSDATVSMDNVYNKVSVKADTYTVDDTIGDITQRQINITCSDATAQQLGINPVDAAFFETIQDDEDPNALLAVWMDAHNDEAAHGGGKNTYTDFSAVKYYNHPNCKFWVYDNNWNDISSKFQKDMTYSIQKYYNSCCLVKYFTKLVSTDKKSSKYIKLVNEYYNAHRNNPNVTTSEFLDKLAQTANINSISWNDAIFISLPSSWNANYEKSPSRPLDVMDENMKYPMFQMQCEGEFSQGSDKSAAIIQGDIFFHCIGGGGTDDAYPAEKGDFKVDKTNWIYPPEDMFITASIQWGNQWWNGEDWQSSKCGFPLNYMKASDRDNESKKKKDTIDAWKVQKTIMTFLPITNTVNWRFGTSEEGCMIKMPQNGNVSGKPILTIYRPHQQRLWKSRKDYNNGDKQQKCRWPSVFYAIKGLKFKSITGDPTYSGVNETDTIYSNVLENNSIQELDEINFKVHTFDNKENSYGSVLKSDGNFVDKLFNKALYSLEKTWIDSSGKLATEGMRGEEHLIFKLMNQYEKPKKIYECDLKSGTCKLNGLYTSSLLTGDYIAYNIETDYRMEKQKIKLIEKE